jgi:hypothetical protein
VSASGWCEPEAGESTGPMVISRRSCWTACQPAATRTGVVELVEQALQRRAATDTRQRERPASAGGSPGRHLDVAGFIDGDRERDADLVLTGPANVRVVHVVELPRPH